MDTNFAAVTIFTLLFAVCTARISLDPQPHCKIEDSNLGFVPSDTEKPRSDGPENMLESGKDQSAGVDLTPRSDFARFHAINRRFFDESRARVRSVHSHPHRIFKTPFVIPRSKISRDMLIRENGNVHAEKFHHEDLLDRLKFKHDYRQHRHQHQYQHQHHHRHHHNHKDNNDVSMSKHKFVRENAAHQHMEETREQKAGLMKSIRKFLKHTLE